MIKSLYVHIPFCLKKCLYCDFNSEVNYSLQDNYIDALVSEITALQFNKVETIFIGGGTPTILSMHNLEKLLIKLSKLGFSEFTVESNPGTLDKEKLKLLKHYGVNRLSIGLQAWQDSLLKGLGRIHNLKDFLNGYSLARKNNFNNINIDLMFGIPNQNMSDWIETLNNVIKLDPEHLSCYSLIIEEGTPFYDLYQLNKLKLVEEEVERGMYDYAIKQLLKNGYQHYEISNFAKVNHECRHNITYWTEEEYIGIGAGAHSYVNHMRYNNVSPIKEYINGMKNGNVIEETSKLSLNDEISEYIFLGLRLIKGIDKELFYKRFNLSIDNLYHDQLKSLESKELIINNNCNIRLTRKGLDLANQVFLEFV